MTVLGAGLETELAAVCGGDRLRGGTVEDRVGEITPTLVVEPADEAEVAALLRACTAAGAAVAVRGAGTAPDWGPPPARCDVVVSLRRLDRLVEHNPGDLVCVVEAGMTLGALRTHVSTAAGHRQALMLDPPGGDGCSVGGVIARNACGSLRTAYGAPRDQLLGVRFVLADGTVGHAGGRVVKNVAGYDIGRLLCGSLGSLAVITQAALRLHPVPAASATVTLESASPRRLADACERLRLLDAGVSVLDVHWPDGLLLVRVDGTPTGVDAEAAEIAAAIGGQRLDAAQASALAAHLAGRPWGGEGAVVGVGVPRSRTAELLEVCSDLVAQAVLRPAAAVAEARCPADAAVVSALRGAVVRLGGHVSLRRGGADLPAELCAADVDPVAAELIAAVKRRFDPTGTLAPGRLGVPG